MSLALLTTYGWVGVFSVVFFGLCVGSFLNVVIYRLPVMFDRSMRHEAQAILEMETSEETEPFNLAVPRSRCPKCGYAIPFYENIPVLSWLALRGKCSQCKTPISARYPGIEALTALASVAVIATFGFNVFAYSVCLLTWLLIAATFIDYDTMLLPDQLTYPMLWLGLLTHLATGGGFTPLPDAIIGAVAGYLFLWLTFWGFKLLTGKEGMGYGDFKLLAALGAWLGWQALPSVILISAVVGLLYAIGRIALRKQTSAQPIPFGPFLAIAGWVTLLYRDTVLTLFLT